MMRRFVIGREGGCDVILRAPSVSRRHAYVSLVRNGKIHFEDADSTNGSYLVEGDNLVRIKERELLPEASLQLGKERISLAEILRSILARILESGSERDRPAVMESPSFRNMPGPGTR